MALLRSMLIGAFAVVAILMGTLGTIYGVEDRSDDTMELQDALRRDLTQGSAIGLLIFAM